SRQAQHVIHSGALCSSRPRSPVFPRCIISGERLLAGASLPVRRSRIPHQVNCTPVAIFGGHAIVRGRAVKWYSFIGSAAGLSGGRAVGGWAADGWASLSALLDGYPY